MMKEATDFIRGLPPKQAKQVAIKAFSLGENPYPHDHAKLRGSSGKYLRVDVGEFRLIYRVEGDTVVIVVIGKRNDDEVYRRLSRK